MTRIKICGITDVETIGLCARLGADFIGLVFAESRRKLTPERALELTHHLFTMPKRPKLAGVFVNAPAYEVNRIAEYCRLDRVQLSGDEDEDYCRRIERPLIRATRIDGDTGAEEIESRIAAARPRTIHLLDRRGDDTYGGSGEKFDWTILGGLEPSLPLMVAGGLTPENVGELILRYHPWGVDVSSGVESRGIKDPAKILAFIRAVKAADARLKGVRNAA
ncbi:phosphoribosylanthranilate isomerase [Dehalogenimonas alkenigignens]|uniref:N-(5'-phosphoribosyl)anthranilate isomerase n=1 Tax=Dehalogenimonas alkenigignens TaxID=1217799 RepID=A0A0W0GHS3_9CHLR|nr:phosphoribosylanthranilate isomerase [Dehalogenimonas alkenigignens]KTB48097.1 phosphoribosylanthranilate isomerase [Dehalogenimonas alkenigignens]PVV84348.1 phosphoribosylanthranilate isomerase [Dehalogenimonas alkenigignens]